MIGNAIQELKDYATEYNGLGMDPEYFDELIRKVQADAWNAGHRKGIRWKRGDATENPYRN